jgi:diguanylate cyclase (GGDEF)-like protein
VFGLGAVVLGVSIQRRVTPGRVSTTAEARPGWRRPFTVLPYVALVATAGLLLRAIAKHLDYRGWVVAVGVLALCAAVMVRQLAALWENSRLLTANQQLNTKLSHHAFHDHLTGLANRALFTERVGTALTRPRAGRLSRSPGATVAVLFVDLDDFKLVNDSLGHHIGDELLVEVADRLGETIRPDDTLCRLGGDEFAILLVDTTQDDAVATARSVVTRLRRPFRPSGIQVRIEASVGVAIGARGTAAPSTAVELLRNADVAMYAAKNAAPKGGWRLFEPSMLTGLLYRHERRAALVRAVECDEFEVHYQPIVDLAGGAVVGAEALARWRPDGDLVLPDDFIPLAEETGLIAEIDRQVLVQACLDAAAWQASVPAFAIHVNLSARQLHRPELVAEVERALRVSGLPARSLTLEIAESGLAHDPEAAAERLRGLTRLGIHLAIDDFGAGYSSLANLRAIPADTLKIDRAFTAELLDETVATPLAQAVIVLAGTLGMHTVAEGIEHPEQARRLLDLGCRRGQGFHFGHPMSAGQLSTLLAAHPTAPPAPRAAPQPARS